MSFSIQKVQAELKRLSFGRERALRVQRGICGTTVITQKVNYLSFVQPGPEEVLQPNIPIPSTVENRYAE